MSNWGTFVECSASSLSNTSAYSSGVLHMWNFSHHGKMIQLMGVECTLFRVILQFHSCKFFCSLYFILYSSIVLAVVMNAISDHFTCCFYPKSTLDEHVAYWFEHPGSDAHHLVELKYTSRGYTFFPVPLCLLH